MTCSLLLCNSFDHEALGDKILKQKLEQRLQSLKTEFDSGQKMLAELEAKQANLQNTLLRISGAIQVLEELLAETELKLGKTTVLCLKNWWKTKPIN